MSKATKDQSSKDNEILNLINGDDDEEEDEEDVKLQLDGDGDNMMEFEELDANNNENNEELKEEEEEESEELKTDKALMRQAIQMASSGGGERGSHGPFPDPICGAVLVSKDGRILGKGRSTYAGHAIEFAFQEAGINATPLREWCVAWPSDAKFRKDISESTLYVTLEPSNERAGEEKPPITQLVEMAGIPRLVIGCQDPIAENASKGAGTLHAAGVSVTMGILQDECNRLIESYATLCNSKIQRMARQHSRIHGRPMGHLHCSVIDSDDAAAFARNGNSFGKNFGGQHLSYRDFGTYEIAPPPESIWAADTAGLDDNLDEFSSEVDDFFTMEFEDEDSQEGLSRNPMMPWYEQVDACVATFPKRKCFFFFFLLFLVFRKCHFIHFPHIQCWYLRIY
jgi:pyrimidine deaminase RibD-like protein